MSFFPLDEVRCGPLKVRRHPQTVIGTANVPTGYRIKERSGCHLEKLPPSFEHFEVQKRREYEHLIKTMEFEEETNRKIKKKKVRQRVQQGLAAYEETVDARREKLREILLKEQMGLIEEVIYKAQHGDDARMDEIRRRTDELRKEQEEQRLAVVAAKRMQQYLVQCERFRENQSKKTAIETKQGNLAQMADNEAKRQADKEMDELWHRLMLKEVEAKMERDVEEAKKRYIAERGAMEELANQVAGKLALEEKKKQVAMEDREHLERLLQKLREEELRRLKEEREKKAMLKKELQDQILEAKRRLAEQARHESEMDRLRGSIAAEELAKERASIKESSAALRNELLAYLRYLEDMRKDEARREAEVDRILEQSLQDFNERRNRAVRQYKGARQRIMDEVLRDREMQMRMKCEKEADDRRKRELEKETLEKQRELEEKLTENYKKDRKEKMLCYRKELEDQWKCKDDARRKEAEEDKEAFLNELKRQEEHEKLTDELLEASENIIPHPFKILLKECAARYAAEKEGRCYCPPPLDEE